MYNMYNNLKVTLFGSCRLEALSNYNNRIKNEISYTYDTKEILEVIKFLKYDHILPEQTITTFRTPMLNNIPIYSKNFEGVLDNTDIFVIEISGRKSYKYNTFFIHSFLYTSKKDLINQIEINKLCDKEIENDILEIINELNTKKIIIVSHIVTEQIGERHELSNLLENICIKYNLLFINPVKEILKKGYDINNLVLNEEKICHYNQNGHIIMKEIYEEYINKAKNI